MSLWRYDGTFDGFLCLLFECAAEGVTPDGIFPGRSDDAPGLFSPRVVITDSGRAEGVRQILKKRLSPRAFDAGYYAFLGADKGREMALFTYYALGWTAGKKIETLLADERVWRVMEGRRKVLRERHRFLGILRFSDLRGVLYAPFEPEADLLPLVGSHFARRLGGERWVIHDLGRGRAALNAQKEWRIADFTLPVGISLSPDEKFFRELWRRYFDSTAVSTRLNPRLQRQFLPKKYWKYLPEKEFPDERQPNRR